MIFTFFNILYLMIFEIIVAIDQYSTFMIVLIVINIIPLGILLGNIIIRKFSNKFENTNHTFIFLIVVHLFICIINTEVNYIFYE